MHVFVPFCLGPEGAAHAGIHFGTRYGDCQNRNGGHAFNLSFPEARNVFGYSAEGADSCYSIWYCISGSIRLGGRFQPILLGAVRHSICTYKMYFDLTVAIAGRSWKQSKYKKQHTQCRVPPLAFLTPFPDVCRIVIWLRKDRATKMSALEICNFRSVLTLENKSHKNSLCPTS